MMEELRNSLVVINVMWKVGCMGGERLVAGYC